jgi:hypothetical protein
MMKVACTTCKILKTRIRAECVETRRGGKQDATRFVYRDEVGGRWNGRTCPPCKRAQVGPAAGETSVGYTYVAPGTKIRNCGSCGGKTVNYFTCSSCLSERLSRNPDCLYAGDLSASVRDQTPLGLGMPGHRKSAGQRG